MPRHRHPAIDRVIEAIELLGDLAQDVVLVGGTAVGLLITDPAAPDARVTLDIDLALEVATRGRYYLFQERLRAKGFHEDAESGVICRWRHKHIVLDVMPTDPAILGFANRWYAQAVDHSLTMTVDDVRFRIVSPAYFLATKLEAFHGRGERDFILSHDMEDMVALIDGRQEIVEDVAQAQEDIRTYLREQFSVLLDDDEFLDALPGYLPGDAASQQRIPLLMERMEHIAGRRQPCS